MIYLISNNISLFDTSEFAVISLKQGIKLLRGLDIISADTETEGLDPYTKKLLLLQLGNYDFQILFDIVSYNNKIPIELVNFLNTHDALYIFQNAKFDLKILFHQGVILKKIYDTMLAEYILTNGLQYDGRDLGTLAVKYCNVYLDKSIRGRIIRVGLSTSVLLYGANDIKLLSLIRDAQLIKIDELNLRRALDLDNSFVVALAYIEYCGIKLDLNKWLENARNNKAELYKLKKVLEDRLYSDGYTKYFSGMLDMFDNTIECIVNWNSPQQVIKIFKDYGINVVLKQKGQSIETVDAKVLEPQVKKFPILELYLKYKELQKEISTYGESWKNYINPVTQRIHTTYKQLNDTGRLSSGSKYDKTPNLQNIPTPKEVRSCFIADKGNVMLDADYSGQETIVLANASQEPNIIEFFNRGLNDMHSYVAFLMYEDIRICSLQDIDNNALTFIKDKHKDKRQIAKSAGFAIAYGGNGSTIAKNCNISKTDGDFVYNAYFEAFPKMKGYFDLVFNRTSYYGHIEFNKITNRKYFFNKEKIDYFNLYDIVNSDDFWQTTPDARSLFKKYNTSKSEIQRYSQNYPIQGTSADITKYATILFFKEILRRNWWLKVKIVNIIHDELLVECPKEMAEEVLPVLVYCMEEAGKPFCRTLPLKADAVTGDYWVH